MTRTEFMAAMDAASAEGWKPVINEVPEVGERVEVMHILNRSYDCEGQYDGEGKWGCANGFILPNMMLVFEPTHWRSKGGEA